MSGAVLDHVTTDPKSGSLIYRRRFPQHLIPLIPRTDGKGLGRKELRVSLKAKNIDDAGAGLNWAAAKGTYEQLVADAERALSDQRRHALGDFDHLSPEIIICLADRYYVSMLGDDDEQRRSAVAKGRFRQVTEAMRKLGDTLPVKSPSAEWTHGAIELHRVIRDAARELRASADYEAMHECWREEALELASRAGYLIDPQGEPLKKLSEAVNDAAVRASEAVLRRLEGEDVPTPPVAPLAPRKDAEEAVEPLEIIAIFDRYAECQGMTNSVRSEWRNYIAHLVKFIGHSDARQLGEDDIRGWRDHLLETPGKRGMRSPLTVKSKYLAALKGVLNWAVEEKLLPANVGKDVKVRVKAREKLRDPYYTHDEARRILAATLLPVSVNLSEHYLRAIRWVPWLCAYTGARVGELAQLRKEDVRLEDGVWTLNLTPEAGSIKNRAARVVPIHDHVIEQGFVEVVKRLPSGHIFYDPSKRRNSAEAEDNRHVKKVGEKVREWLKRDVGMQIGGIQPNHAWRHLFKTLADEAGISERTCDAIQGHAPGNVSRSYGGTTLNTKVDAMKRFPRFEV